MSMKKNWQAGKVLAFFSATWCGHCNEFKPVWEQAVAQLKTEHSDVQCIQFDADELDALKVRPEVFGFPTIRAYRDGVMVEEFENARTVDNLKSFVREHLAAGTTSPSSTPQKGGAPRQRRRRSRTTAATRVKKSKSKSRAGALVAATAAPVVSGAPLQPYAVDVASPITPGQQWNSATTAAPPPEYNGGLYTGPPFAGPWGNVPVTPTTTNYIHNNLRSAEPPPGATTQYPGTNRMANNYSAKPGVNWLAQPSRGPYRIQCTTKPQKGGRKHASRRGRSHARRAPQSSRRRLRSAPTGSKKIRARTRSARKGASRSTTVQKAGGACGKSAAGVGIAVDKVTNIPPGQQWSSSQTAAPPPEYNGGLYTGPPFAGPWGNVPVTPTTANYIHNNLRSAEPPPGATEQYPGTAHPGNNFSAMPGVHWLDVPKQGPYRIQCTRGGGASRRRKPRRDRRRRHSTKTRNR